MTRKRTLAGIYFAAFLIGIDLLSQFGWNREIHWGNPQNAVTVSNIGDVMFWVAISASLFAGSVVAVSEKNVWLIFIAAIPVFVNGAAGVVFWWLGFIGH